MNFKLVSDYKPQGDQPEAIDALVRGLEDGEKHQVLLGITGSGKTFSVASVVERVNRPTLDDRRYGKGLARSGNPQQHLMLLAVFEAAHKGVNSFGLIALRFVIRNEFKVHSSISRLIVVDFSCLS